MKTKFLKLLYFITMIIFLFSLSSCFKEEKYNLKEGTFSYINGDFELVDDLYVEEIKLKFKRITLEEFNERNHINCVKDRKNKNPYSVELYIKFLGEEIKQYDILVLDKVGDQVDRFHIRYQIDKEIFKGYNMFSVFELYNESKDTVVSEIRFYFQELEAFDEYFFEINRKSLHLRYEE